MNKQVCRSLWIAVMYVCTVLYVQEDLYCICNAVLCISGAQSSEQSVFVVCTHRRCVGTRPAQTGKLSLFN